MRIALLASTFLPRIGGAEVVVNNMARQLLSRGHEVRVITWWGQWNGIHGRVEYAAWPLLPRSYSASGRQRWQSGRGSTAFVGAQVNAMQRFFRFDLWKIHGAQPAGMLAVPALDRTGVPLVTTCHGDAISVVPECGYRILENMHISEAVTRSLQLSQKVTAITNSVRERYMELEVPPDRVADVPDGVDFNRIFSFGVNRREVRARYDWPLDRPLILPVGCYH